MTASYAKGGARLGFLLCALRRPELAADRDDAERLPDAERILGQLLVGSLGEPLAPGCQALVAPGGELRDAVGDELQHVEARQALGPQQRDGVGIRLLEDRGDQVAGLDLLLLGAVGVLERVLDHAMEGERLLELAAGALDILVPHGDGAFLLLRAARQQRTAHLRERALAGERQCTVDARARAARSEEDRDEAGGLANLGLVAQADKAFVLKDADGAHQPRAPGEFDMCEAIGPTRPLMRLDHRGDCVGRQHDPLESELPPAERQNRGQIDDRVFTQAESPIRDRRL